MSFFCVAHAIRIKNRVRVSVMRADTILILFLNRLSYSKGKINFPPLKRRKFFNKFS